MSTRVLFAALLLSTLTWAGCVVETAPAERQPQPVHEDTSRAHGSVPLEPAERTEDVLVDSTDDRPYVTETAPQPVSRVTVSVNRGAGGGIKEGDTYDVFALEDEMIDPDTGDSLGFSEVKVGRIQITRTLPKYSKSELIGGGARKGDICRLAKGEATFHPHPGTSTSKAGGKASLAVAPFTFHRNVRRTPGTELETGAFTQKFVTALVKTNKFDVVERSRVDTLFKEMKLSDAGFTDPARAVKAGKMLGADHFLMGEVSVWTHTTRVKEVPRTTRFFRETELLLIVDMRIVDSRTGKIVAAEKGEASIRSKKMFKQRPASRVPLDQVQIDQITRDCVKDLVRMVIDVVYPLKVIAVSGQSAPPPPPPPPPADTTGPRISFVQPADGANLSASPVRVVIEVTDDRHVGRVTIAGKEAAGQGGRYSARVALREGQNTISAKAWDGAGNTSSAAVRVTYTVPDTQAPVVTILAPRDRQAINSTPINVVAEVTDDRGVERVEINGVQARQDDKGRYVVAISKPRPGANGVQVKAWDGAGNMAEARSQFAFDATPPEVQADATLLVEGKVDDLSSTLTINGVKVNYESDGTYSVRVKADPANPGTVVIVAVDEFGNKTREVRKVR